MIIVDAKKCIGCGVCTQICPEIFALDEDRGVAEIILPDAPVDSRVKKAFDSCPVSCIKAEQK